MAESSAVEDPRHRVLFWEDASALAEQVARHLLESLGQGGSAVAIARPSTLAAIERHLAHASVEVARLVDTGRLALLDAHQVVSSLLVDGLPDAARFSELVASRARAMVALGGPVHAYGEMV